MTDLRELLSWPFFESHHREAAERVEAFATEHLSDGAHPEERADVDARCRALVRELGAAGIAGYCVRAADGGAHAEFDARAICLARERLALSDGLADFAFAMQGL